MARVAQQDASEAVAASQAEALLRQVEALHTAQDSHALFPAIVEAASVLTGGRSSALFMEVGQEWRCVAATAVAGVQALRHLVPLQKNWPPAGQMQATRQPTFLAEATAGVAWPDLRAARQGALTMVGWLGIPLVLHGRLRGFFDVAYDAQPTPSEVKQHQEVLTRYAALAGPPLHAALRRAETEARLDQLKLRADLLSYMRSCHDRVPLLQGVIDRLCTALEISLCAYVAPTGLTLLAARGLGDGDAGPEHTRHTHLARMVVGLLPPRREAIQIADLAASAIEHDGVFARREELLSLDVRSILSTTVDGPTDKAGSFVLAQLGEPRWWSPGEVVLIEEIAKDTAEFLARIDQERTAKQEMLKLRRERDRLSYLIQALPIGVLVTDAASDEPTFWNAAADALAQSRTVDDRSAPLIEVLAADGTPLPRHLWPHRRTVEQNVAGPAQELLLRRQNGTVAPVAIESLPLHDEHGRVVSSLTFITDLESVKQTEEQRRLSEASMQVLAATIETLATNRSVADALQVAAHQVRTLLSFDLMTLSVVESDHPVFTRLAGAGSLPNAPDDDDVNLIEEPLARHAIECGTPLVLDDLSNPAAEFASSAAALGVKSCLIVPLQLEPPVMGTLNVLSQKTGAFSAAPLQLFEQMAALLSATINLERGSESARDAAGRQERERLARELHDTLAQTITSVVMLLDSVVMAMPTDDALRGRLEQARGMARSALVETRRSVWNLRAPNVDLETPLTILHEECAVLERRGHARPKIVQLGELQPVALEIGAVIQRLARVAIENVLMHSGARNVRVLLDFGPQSLTVSIEDDGEGFDPDAVISSSQSRVGLAGLAERVRVVGGSLSIESAKGRGTRVFAQLPYNPVEPSTQARTAAQPPIPVETTAAPSGSVTRVLLIDDHTMVREGLEQMLQDQPDLQIVGGEATGADGLRRIAELQPDVVLCDLQLPDMSGVEVIAKTRTHFPAVRCLVVTTYDSDEFIYEGIKAGAKGFVLKDVSAAELVSAVRAAARNESLLQPVVARRLVERFADLARQDDAVETLTEREVEVLRALATGARNKEIAFSLGLSESTIKTHLASVFGKLGVTTRTEAVSRGRDLGLIAL